MIGRSTVLALLAVVLLAPAGRGEGTPTTRQLLDRVQELRLKHDGAGMDSLATAVVASLEREDHPDTLLLAEALFDVCHARNLERDFSDSTGLKAGLRSLELFGTRPDAPDTLVFACHRTLGWTLTQFRGSAEGIEQYRLARAIARRRPDWGGIPLSVVLYNLGTSFTNVGEADSALAAFRESLKIRRRIAMPRDVLPGDIYAGMGMAYEQQGKDDLAEDAFRSAIRSDEEQLGPDHPVLIDPLSRAADFEFHRGNYAAAIDDNQRALRLYEPLVPPDDPDLLLTRCAVAQAMEALGDLRGARAVFEKNVPAVEMRLGPRHTETLAGWLSLASVYAKLGDTGHAFRLYEHVRLTFAGDTSGVETAPLRTALAGEAELLQARGEADSALARAEQAESLVRASREPETDAILQALCVQLSVHAGRKDWDAVDRDNGRIQKILDRMGGAGTGPSDRVWITRSRVSALRGRHAEAVAAAAEGARRVRERLVRNVLALSDRQALLLANTLSGPLDQLLRVGARSDPRSVHRAWDELVRARGLVRAEVAGRRLPAAAADDSSLASAHADWVAAERRLAQFEVHAAISPREAADDSILAALRGDVDETGRRLAAAMPSGALPDPGPVGLDSVLTWLDPGQALVGFAQAPMGGGERHLLAFVATGGEAWVQSLDLGEVGELGALVARWRAELGQPDPARRSEASCRRAGEAVRERIWDPIADAADQAKVLYLVPEAPVTGLPWNALPVGDSRYLAESDFEVHVLEAERELVKPAVRGAGAGLLAVGSVNYDRGRPEAPAPDAALAAAVRAAPSDCGELAVGHLPPLPGTGGEVRDVEGIWDGEAAPSGPAILLEGDAATEAAFKREAVGREVIHLATHGIVLSDTCGDAAGGMRGVGGLAPVGVDSAGATSPPEGEMPPALPPSPWLGRQVLLALADANHASGHTDDENEGLLTAEEVTTLDLRGVDWVVLSACHTASGEAWSREGVLGMERAFHLAGAHTVIATQWSVDDEATREWMRDLYRARARGVTDGDRAVAAADRAVLADRRRDGRPTDPFYWAAFTASGE